MKEKRAQTIKIKGTNNREPKQQSTQTIKNKGHKQESLNNRVPKKRRAQTIKTNNKESTQTIKKVHKQ